MAAGFGSRMGGALPKPLKPLFGLPLIDHNIIKLREIVGEENIIVVYSNKALADHIKERFPRIQLAFNSRPERENGYSLLFSEGLIKDNFILTMADHYFSDDFISNLRLDSPNKAFVSRFCDDRDEATKVKTEGIYITDIGKTLKDYDYFDTGMFFCNKDIFPYIEKLSKEREIVKLSDVFGAMAKEKKLTYQLIEGYWIDIDTQSELTKAERFIRNNLSKPTDGPVSKYINRKISTLITPLLIGRIKPNTLTLILSVMGIIPSILMAYGHFFLGGILTQLISSLDGCDGEIARITHTKSRLGGVLDSTLDRYSDSLIFFCSFMPFSGLLEAKIALLLTLAGTILISYTSHLTGCRPRFITRDVRLLLVMIGGILSLIRPIYMLHTMLFIGIVSHIGVFFNLLSFAKKEKTTKQNFAL